MTSFPSCTWSRRGFFSDIYCGNLGEYLEENFTVLWGQLMTDWFPWSFYLSGYFTKPSAICQLHCRFSYSCCMGSHWYFCSFGNLWLTLFSCLSLQYAGAVAVCPVFSPVLWIQEQLLMFSACSVFCLLLG